MNHHGIVKFWKRSAAIVLFAALCAVPGTIAYQQSQSPQGKVEFPATPEGNLAHGLVDAINSGDNAKIDSFVKNNFSSRVLKQDEDGDQQTTLRRIAAQSGGVDLMGLLPARQPGEIRMRLRTKRGGYWVNF